MTFEELPQEMQAQAVQHWATCCKDTILSQPTTNWNCGFPMDSGEEHIDYHAAAIQKELLMPTVLKPIEEDWLPGFFDHLENIMTKLHETR